MPVVFPRYPANAQPQFRRIAAALLTEDQFDDWLPDPVYYQDRADDEPALQKRVDAAWTAGSPAKFEAETLTLPRASGKQAPALALPLEIRICAHATITAMAPRVAKALRRDKVYGFRFLRDGNRVFDPPGAELDDVFRLVLRAMEASREEAFYLLDMAGFSAAARPERLSETLQSAGARADEANIVVGLARLGGEGLPSVDDAFAFAYNFYLQPVDEELFRAKKNFFRYRDEYFVFDPDTQALVKAGVQKLGLTAVDKGRSKNLSDLQFLGGRLSRRNPERSTVLLELPNGSITATVSCRSFGSEGCSDRIEIAFEKNTPPIKTLFKLPPGQLVDAVNVLPMLRAIHRQRRPGVLLAPPFGAAAPEFVVYRSNLSQGRAWLHAALDAAVRADSSWQAGWCATLLSDIGAFSEAETQSVLRAARSTALKEPARAQARIALARSSALKEAEFWGRPASATEFQRRAVLVAARHLSRRSASAWNGARASLGAQEPELVRHLAANIQGVS